LSKPAIRNMDEPQLHDAISLALKIIAGEANLCQLNEESLRCRGKTQPKHSSTATNQSLLSPGSRKRTAKQMAFSDDSMPQEKKKSKGLQSTLDSWHSQSQTHVADGASDKVDAKQECQLIEEMRSNIKRIRSHSSLTPYRKRLYTILCSVPRGRYTTYAAMSNYLESSARAVGSGMRNNPFAPDVPCHRVLASDRSIGGFHGDWGADGKYASKKVELLRSEGVKFDGRGKVIGEPFREFHEFRGVLDDNAVG
jgi:O-6-methylguanine DNA methyltransferase